MLCAVALKLLLKPPIYADSNKLWSFIWPPDIINFLLKSLSVTTSVQSKQIYSFDELETHTRSIVLVGVEPTIFTIPLKDFKGNLRHQLQVASLLIFGAKRK